MQAADRQRRFKGAAPPSSSSIGEMHPSHAALFRPPFDTLLFFVARSEGCGDGDGEEDIRYQVYLIVGASRSACHPPSSHAGSAEPPVLRVAKMIKTWLLSLATRVILATAQVTSITPTNFTTSTADLEAEDGFTLLLTESAYWVPIASVLPLTTSAKTLPAGDISGTARLVSPSSDVVPKAGDIAIISCDSSPGYLSPLDSFTQAQNANVTAILLYTIHSDYCSLQGQSGSFSYIYSMKSQNATSTMLKVVNTPDEVDEGQVVAAIEYADETKAPPSSGKPKTSPLGPSPTTAVAMIILYSVTGLITILFLVIIMSGAIRAHRHPERYGPRNGGGRPRQSRAKGLARAMLDTLPIVKFSERDNPKPTDVELADHAGVEVSATEIAERPSVQTPNNAPAPLAPETGGARQSVEVGIAAATNPEQASNRDHLGCSICTEDFEDGQDQRVLPCGHKYHPECVDPWLLNVSGTCPLCRVDLRPALHVDENGEPIVGEDGSEAPPLGLQDTAGERQRMTIRRSIMIGIMGVGRRPDMLSREERLIALRELRGQRILRQSREEQAAVAETPEEERRVRRTLRSLARRRTTTASGSAPEQQSTEAEVLGDGRGVRGVNQG